MTGTLTETALKPTQPREGLLLFLRRWLANPLRMGSVVPSSPALCSRLVRHGWPEARTVALELGAGTGLNPRREAWTPLNLPPASVWRYTPAK